MCFWGVLCRFWLRNIYFEQFTVIAKQDVRARHSSVPIQAAPGDHYS